MTPVQNLLHRSQRDTEFAKGEFMPGYYDRVEDHIVQVLFPRMHFERGEHFAFHAVKGDGSVHREGAAWAESRSAAKLGPTGRDCRRPPTAWRVQSRAGSGGVSVDACAARLRCHVQALAGDIGERNVWQPAALAAAASYIRGELEALGYAVQPQTYRVNDVDCANLEVVIPGAAKSQEIVLVGAHYDTVKGSPGADDNASGIAGILELARQLRGARLARTVKLVAFVNEEPPFFFFGEMGSKVYAQAARRRGDDIRVMLSLEMLGCYSDTPRSQAYPPFLRWFYPDRGNFIAFVSNLRSRLRLREVVAAFRANSGFPSERLAGPAFVPGVAWSDQLSFWRQGYAAVMVTDTAFYRYRHYHGRLDTPEKLSYPEMAQVVTGLAKTIAALAGEPRGPVRLPSAG